MQNNTTIEIPVSLSPDEAMYRIENASDEDHLAFSLSGHAGDKPFLLQRKADRFRVEKRIFYRNSFHPFFYARIEPTAYGSRISGYFAMGKLERISITLWFAVFGLAGIFSIPGLLIQYQRGEIGEKGLLWIFHPIGMILFMYLLVTLGKFLSRKEAPAITALLRDLFADVTLKVPDEQAPEPASAGAMASFQTVTKEPTHRFIPAKKSYWKYLLVWGALAAAIVLLIGSLNWRSYYLLAAHGRCTQATIIALLPQDHNTARYQYQVNGRTFEGQMQSWEPNPPLEQMKVGQIVVVYYDPANPAESVLGDPRPILQNETIFILLAALIMPTIIVIAWLGHNWW